MISKVLLWLGVLVSRQDQYYELKVAALLLLAFLFAVWVVYLLIWVWRSIEKDGAAGTWNRVKETLEGLFYFICFFGAIALLVSFGNWLFN